MRDSITHLTFFGTEKEILLCHPQNPRFAPKELPLLDGFVDILATVDLDHQSGSEIPRPTTGLDVYIKACK